MIVLFRIDYRLLHFQTASVWPKKVNATEIIVASDEVVKDELQIGLIRMMAPKNYKLKILPIEDTIRYLNSPESESQRIELLTASPADSVRIAESVSGIKHVCAALMKGTRDKKMVSKTLAFGPEDYEAFRRLLELGVQVESYSVPEDTPIPIQKYLV